MLLATLGDVNRGLEPKQDRVPRVLKVGVWEDNAAIFASRDDEGRQRHVQAINEALTATRTPSRQRLGAETVSDMHNDS